MKITTIRNLDVFVGKPLAFALTACRKALDMAAPPPPLKPRKPAKILLIKLTEQGATVLAYRAMARAIEMVGRENVYFWVFKENRPILDIMGLIPPENVLAVNAGGAIRAALDLIRSILRIRRLGIDATVDMEFFARAPAVLAFLTGAKSRVGLHRFTAEGPYRGDLLTHRVWYNPYLHTAIGYHTLVEALLADPQQIPMLKQHAGLSLEECAPPPFVVSAAELAEARDILRHVCGGASPAGPLILLNPNASDMLPLRKWPTERFVEVGRELLARYPAATILITGAPGERASAERVARQIGGSTASLASHTTLRQLMVIYTLADVLVTNDSGPGHFASMTDLHTVVLFGPETPALYAPLGKHTNVMWTGIACSPCVNVLNHRFSPCEDNVCMQRITPADVVMKVSELLQRRKTNAYALPVLQAIA